MTQNLIKALVALGVVVVLAFGAVALFDRNPSFGGSAYEALPKQFGNGLSAGLSSQLTVDSSGNITFANASGTSTLSGIGCINTYPTSSLTSVKQVYTTVATSSGPSNNGFVLWKYGTCP
jgi:hypothetical protein